MKFTSYLWQIFGVTGTAEKAVNVDPPRAIFPHSIWLTGLGRDVGFICSGGEEAGT